MSDHDHEEHREISVLVSQLNDRSGFENEIRRLYPTSYSRKLERFSSKYTDVIVQGMWLGWRMRGNFDALGNIRES